MIEKTEWVFNLRARVISRLPINEVEALGKIFHLEIQNYNGIQIKFDLQKNKEEKNAAPHL